MAPTFAQCPRIAVIGGGAAGVSAAFWLRRYGAAVEVFEAGRNVGGRCLTVERDGFRFDLGAGALPSTNAAIVRLANALGVSNEFQMRGAVIGALRDGEVHRIARRNPLTFLGTRNIPTRDKLALWRLGVDLGKRYRSINSLDLSEAARFDTESMHAYCSRRYPDTVRDNLLEPITRALLLVEPEQTSALDLFASCKSLLVAGHIMAHPQGVAFFLDRAAAHLNVHLGASVSQVEAAGDTARVTWTSEGQDYDDVFDGVVVALPAAETLAVHPGLSSPQRRYLADLEYSTATVVALGIERAPDETSSMVLIPRDINPDLAVVGLGHNLAPTRVPDGGGVLTTFWMSDWSRRNAHLTDNELVAETQLALESLFPSWKIDVATSAVARWPRAVVASRVGTYASLVDFHARVDPRDRIQLAGDYHAQTSVNSSVAAGERAANSIAERFGLLGNV